VDNFHGNESIVTPVFIYQVVKGLKEGRTVWFEAINDTIAFRNRVLTEIEKFVFADEIETIYMDTDIEIALARNAAREDATRMPDDLVRNIHNNLVPPTAEEFHSRGYETVTLTVVTTKLINT
jgi:predicted kinase